MRSSVKLLILAGALNVVSVGIILVGLLKIKKWIAKKFDGFRRWRCTKDGKFLIYLLLLILVTILELTPLVLICRVDVHGYEKSIDEWYNNAGGDFYYYFIVILFINAFNFGMTIFALYMQEKISRASWSDKHRDAVETQQTT